MITEFVYFPFAPTCNNQSSQFTIKLGPTNSGIIKVLITRDLCNFTSSRTSYTLRAFVKYQNLRSIIKETSDE